MIHDPSPTIADLLPARAARAARWPELALQWLDSIAASHAALRGLRAAVMRDLLLPEAKPALADEPSTAAASADGESSQISREQLARHIEGKVVLITGGSSGIGLETARRVAVAGAKTLICARDLDKLTSAQRQLARAGGDVRADAVNLADPRECDAFAGRLLERHGAVDVLINNAGRSIRRSVQHSFERFHDFQRTMQLNYFGALRLTMRLLPAMARQRSGHVINVSSIGVLMGSPRFSAYAASKAALDTWTRCAASEYADVGVAFTTIYMPLVRTPMSAPTESYGRVPALSAEGAAELAVRAIVERPARIATSLGTLGDLAHALAPHWTRSLGNYLFRSAP
ncbi:MAG TPA: SDR family NAD(P)-dependent oxidoreductase [Polyangiaceae bacterium]|nr:SDR family NAD(P)-dependent oxidoreductase [Polyangiaceae bacterium]